MDTIGASEAKRHFSQLLERVAEGRRITISRYGVPVAVLEPVQRTRRVPVSAVIAQLREFRSRHRLGGASIREMIEDGRD